MRPQSHTDVTPFLKPKARLRLKFTQDSFGLKALQFLSGLPVYVVIIPKVVRDEMRRVWRGWRWDGATCGTVEITLANFLVTAAYEVYFADMAKSLWRGLEDITDLDGKTKREGGEANQSTGRL